MIPCEPAPSVAHVAVVGAGPAGIFTAQELVTREDVRVDVFDTLPSPYGLVRYGVAPDHTRIKSVASSLAKVMAHPHVRFVGNTRVGGDVGLDELLERYAAVVLTTGATTPRRLAIPGAELAGSLTAAELVAWYNGHPHDGLAPAGPADSAAVVGAGNVALDVARVLLKGGTGLAETDAPDEVLTRLDQLGIGDVHLVARRGLPHLRFTLPELLALDGLPGLRIEVSGGLALSDVEEEHRATTPVFARIVGLFQGWAGGSRPDGDRTLHFHLETTPVRVTGSSHVTGLEVTTAGRSHVLPAGLVVAAIGSTATPVPGMAIDHERGVLAHTAGRVAPRIYVAGWAKRGPSGVIGTNKACAAETAGLVLADLDTGAVAQPTELPWADGPHPAAVGWDDWLRLDHEERRRGEAQGRPRVKVVDLAEQLAVARAPHQTDHRTTDEGES